MYTKLKSWENVNQLIFVMTLYTQFTNDEQLSTTNIIFNSKKTLKNLYAVKNVCSDEVIANLMKISHT